MEYIFKFSLISYKENIFSHHELVLVNQKEIEYQMEPVKYQIHYKYKMSFRNMYFVIIAVFKVMKCRHSSTYVLKWTLVTILTFQTSGFLFMFSPEKLENESSIVIWAQQKQHRLEFESLLCLLLNVVLQTNYLLSLSLHFLTCLKPCNKEIIFLKNLTNDKN